MSRPISFANARAQYVHRYTLEHVPTWARAQAHNGKYYAPQFRTDAEWYATAHFPGEHGVKRGEDHCLSAGQTWPLGQWLRAPLPHYAYLAVDDDAKLATMRSELEAI